MAARFLTTPARAMASGGCSGARPREGGSCLTDDRGATTLEWGLLLAGVGIPSMYIFTLLLQLLVAHYQLNTTINSLPLP